MTLSFWDGATARAVFVPSKYIYIYIFIYLHMYLNIYIYLYYNQKDNF